MPRSSVHGSALYRYSNLAHLYYHPLLRYLLVLVFVMLFLETVAKNNEEKKLRGYTRVLWEVERTKRHLGLGMTPRVRTIQYCYIPQLAFWECYLPSVLIAIDSLHQYTPFSGREEYIPMPNYRPNKRGRIGAFPAFFFFLRFCPTARSSIEGSTYSHGKLEPDTLYQDSRLYYLASA